MTFSQYWEAKGMFGGSPEEVANLAWDAATNRAAEIAEATGNLMQGQDYPYSAFAVDFHRMAAKIRSGE